MKMDKYIDHTLLRADATYDKIETLCAEVKEYDFASVCINSYWISACAGLLRGTDAGVRTVVDFPLGAMSIKAKALGTTAAIADGAKEIDMVLNIGETKAGHYDAVRADMKAVVEAAGGSYVKVILKNCLPTKEGIIKTYELCMEADAAFVKTSTRFSTSGATPEDAKLMKDTMKGRCLVKAAGGIRCYKDMKKMVEAEADRIGTSADMKLMQKETSGGGY